MQNYKITASNANIIIRFNLQNLLIIKNKNW